MFHGVNAPLTLKKSKIFTIYISEIRYRNHYLSTGNFPKIFKDALPYVSVRQGSYTFGLLLCRPHTNGKSAMDSRTSSSTATRPSHRQIETNSSTQRGGGGAANRPMQIRTVDLDVEKDTTDDEMEDITPQLAKLALSTKADPRLKLGSG